MRNNQRTAFPNVTSEGALLPVDVLQRVAEFDASIGGIAAEDYHHDGEKLNEVINDAWLHVLRVDAAVADAVCHEDDCARPAFGQLLCR